MSPELYGFNPEWCNIELANEMHKQNLSIQNGGDLTITVHDWFFHHIERSDKINPAAT